MNQWVREAIEHSGMSGPELAEALTRAGAGSFDRSKIQKMTVSRKVSKAEAEAISRVTGYPLDPGKKVSEFDGLMMQLSDANKAVVERMVQVLLDEQERSKSGRP